jgi:NADH-quinone oxidoreductase subunit F
MNAMRGKPMARLTPETLKELSEQMARFLEVRNIHETTPGKPVYPFHLLLCGGTACHASKSVEVKQRLEEEIEKRGLQDKAMVFETGCNGFCAQGPVMSVFPGGIFYQYLEPSDALEIIEQHIIKGYPVERLMFRDPSSGEVIPRMKDIPFFALQETRVLRNRGLIAAERLEECLGRGGYQGACKALTEMTPEEIINEVKGSGLRGRGGAGFPTGLKWEFASKSEGPVKYVLCNADEGDPGAFMDRSVLEADPHAVIEGMVIAAKAIGSHRGYIYCRAEYPLAIKRLTLAIDQAKEAGLLGKDILGSGFDFDLEIYQGAGAFVCGEETALITSIEGKRGMPRPRPPFPAQRGLWGKPTILNNVETLANIPQIILKGGDWYASLGTERSKGTKVFALTGNVNNVGLVEVPMGTRIGTIIFDIGGGIKHGKEFKAAQLGGPSGGCIPSSFLNTPTDYEAIVNAGAIMGSGGLIVMDGDTCMVDMARFFINFCQDESCGKCTPCREGTKRMLVLLEKITKGQAELKDLDELEELAYFVKDASLCGLGQTAPNPVLSTLQHFRDEYLAHVVDKRCRAGVCADLFKAPCINACPAGMDVPAYVALIRAGRVDDAYKILKKTNPFPAVCGRVCTHVCQDKCRRGQLDAPVPIMYLKRFITDSGKRPVGDVPAVTRKEKIAIVGAGPSGLTAAQDLAYRGYEVTVYDEHPRPGGMLRYGIPEYRLPREVIDGEIEDIESLGVKILCNTRIGKEVTLQKLMENYDRIYLAVGAQKSLKLNVEGEDFNGVIGAVEFLKRLGMDDPPSVGERVAVIGGGNSAIDAARCALRLGADEVSILYRRTMAEMPAQEAEVKAAQREGVKIEGLTAPVRIIGENGGVKAIECLRMELGEFDASGRRRPVPVEGSECIIKADNVIVAIGQAPDLSFLSAASAVKASRWDTIEVVDQRRTVTHNEKIYAGGDVVTGPRTVIEAIAAGHGAAADIDRDIRLANGEPLYEPPAKEEIQIPFEVDEETRERLQAEMPELALSECVCSFKEVELGYGWDQARTEAQSCLRCDVEIE